MHYKNGRLAKIGDVVYGNPFPSDPSYKDKVYYVTGLYPGATSCNIIVTRELSHLPFSYDTLFAATKGTLVTTDTKNFIHIDDFLNEIVPRVIEGEEVPQL